MTHRNCPHLCCVHPNELDVQHLFPAEECPECQAIRNEEAEDELMKEMTDGDEVR